MLKGKPLDLQFLISKELRPLSIEPNAWMQGCFIVHFLSLQPIVMPEFKGLVFATIVGVISGYYIFNPTAREMG